MIAIYMLWNRKLDSKEYTDLIKSVSRLEARLDKLEIENETLRNKVLRKIQQKRDEIVEDSEHSSQVKTIGMVGRWG